MDTTRARDATRTVKAAPGLFRFSNHRLERGGLLPEVEIAYETYGKLAPGGRNAVLVTHGYTNSHRAAGRHGDEYGWWDALIGPGKAIDTDRCFVVSSNMLGSSYGSTHPASRNPATGKPYGPDFPDITLADIVGAQKRLLESLGVTHLVAVAGRSYGGTQAFAWGVMYPDFVNGLVIANSAPKRNGGDKPVHDLVARFAQDPNWNGGWYYDNGGIGATLAALRVETLERYGYGDVLARTHPDPQVRKAIIRERADAWSRMFDANGMLALLRAAMRFDAEPGFPKMRAKVLYTLTTTDRLYPPDIAPAVMDKLRAAGVDATYFLLESPYGHDATTPDAAKLEPVLREFMARVMERHAS